LSTAPDDPKEQAEPLGPLDKPSLKAALTLLLPAALCAGLLYLWIGKPAESLVYGGMVGAGLAAVVVEFIKYFRWLRENPEARDRGPLGTVLHLALAAFRLGFVKTFTEVMRELLKLAGLKFVVTILIAVIAFFVARAGHWF
jgi:hypothetical protein